MRAARGLNLSPTKSRDAKLYTSSRAQSTTSVHSQVVEVFLAYLRKRNLPATTFQERVLQDFIHYLEDIRKPYSFLKQVCGSLKAWSYIIDQPVSEFSQRVSRLLEGAVRRAATERAPVRKATPIPKGVLTAIMRKIVYDYDSIWDIPLPFFRATVAIILQFHTFTRLADLDQVRACHISQDQIGGVEVLRVIYPKRKNDQEHEGCTNLLASEGGDLCPVVLIKKYYRRCGFQFMGEGILDENFLFCRTSTMWLPGGRQIVADGRYQLSPQTLLNDITQLCRQVGYFGPVGRKSCKMSGVSAACEAGLSDEALRDKGKWRSIEMSRMYRQMTEPYQMALSRCITMQDDPQITDFARNSGQPIYRGAQNPRSTSHPQVSRRPSPSRHEDIMTQRPQDRPASAAQRLFPCQPVINGHTNRAGLFHNIVINSPFTGGQRTARFVDDGIVNTRFTRNTDAFRSWF